MGQRRTGDRLAAVTGDRLFVRALGGMSVGLVFGISTNMSTFTPLLTGVLADQLGLDSAFRLLIALPLLATLMTLFLYSNNRMTLACATKDNNS
jgi:hypothetical protein